MEIIIITHVPQWFAYILQGKIISGEIEKLVEESAPAIVEGHVSLINDLYVLLRDIRVNMGLDVSDLEAERLETIAGVEKNAT